MIICLLASLKLFNFFILAGFVYFLEEQGEGGFLTFAAMFSLTSGVFFQTSIPTNTDVFAVLTMECHCVQ